MKISVIVRSRNDAGMIADTMTRLFAQKLPAGCEAEIINIDNNSSDGTAGIVREMNPVGQVVEWREKYVPGRVLNAGVALATGEIVVFHNSDCTPQGDGYLAALVAPLLAKQADLVFGNQLPRADARPLVVKDYRRAFGDGREAATWRHMFSLVSSAASRELLLAEPFDESLQYSEDIEWSYRLRRKGCRIVYVPEAKSIHSHNYTLAETWKRFFNEGVADAAIFDEKPRFFRGFFFTLGREYMRDLRFLAVNGYWAAMPRELFWRLVQRFAHYRGLCAAERQTSVGS
ncbi:MAG: glycosyltransferase [Victivallaceae bacterium]|nr:glycosyltransferase [Victivallaceae bacterium]